MTWAFSVSDVCFLHTHIKFVHLFNWGHTKNTSMVNNIYIYMFCHCFSFSLYKYIYTHFWYIDTLYFMDLHFLSQIVLNCCFAPCTLFTEKWSWLFPMRYRMLIAIINSLYKNIYVQCILIICSKYSITSFRCHLGIKLYSPSEWYFEWCVCIKKSTFPHAQRHLVARVVLRKHQ